MRKTEQKNEYRTPSFEIKANSSKKNEPLAVNAGNSTDMRAGG